MRSKQGTVEFYRFKLLFLVVCLFLVLRVFPFHASVRFRCRKDFSSPCWTFPFIWLHFSIPPPFFLVHFEFTFLLPTLFIPFLFVLHTIFLHTIPSSSTQILAPGAVLPFFF